MLCIPRSAWPRFKCPWAPFLSGGFIDQRNRLRPNPGALPKTFEGVRDCPDREGVERSRENDEIGIDLSQLAIEEFERIRPGGVEALMGYRTWFAFGPELRANQPRPRQLPARQPGAIRIAGAKDEELHRPGSVPSVGV